LSTGGRMANEIKGAAQENILEQILT